MIRVGVLIHQMPPYESHEESIFFCKELNQVMASDPTMCDMITVIFKLGAKDVTLQFLISISNCVKSRVI